MNLQSVTRPNTKIKICYETVGKPDGEPLLFLHGLGAGRVQTTSALGELPDTYLIAPDMLGHGDSISQDDSAVQSFDQFADDCICILESLGIKKVNLGGLSMGAGISINIALRYPEYINKLILLRPSWLNEKQPKHLALVAYVGQWIKEHGVKKAQELLKNHSDFIDLQTRVPMVAASICALFDRPQHLSHTSVLHKMWHDAPFTTLEQLQSISNQTLILHTTRDDLHPVIIADSIETYLPQAKSISLPPRYDAPQDYSNQLTQKVTNFLK